MNEIRKEFDKTETAKFWMHTTVYFDYEKDQYVSSKIECSHYAQIINAAFMMFQEQHKKLVAYQKMIEIQKGFDEANAVFSSVERIANSMLHNGEYLIDTSTVDKPQQNTIVNIINSMDDDKIKEIFMVNSNELRNNR